MNNANNISAEERIKTVAHEASHQKDYATMCTRDIAEEAGINHTMLSYYFRSKEKPFQIVMTETTTQFFRDVGVILNDETTSLDEKIEHVVTSYIDLLLEEPDLPTFILNEVCPSP